MNNESINSQNPYAKKSYAWYMVNNESFNDLWLICYIFY